MARTEQQCVGDIASLLRLRNENIKPELAKAIADHAGMHSFRAQRIYLRELVQAIIYITERVADDEVTELTAQRDYARYPKYSEDEPQRA